MRTILRIGALALFLCAAGASHGWAQLAFCPSGTPHAKLISATTYTIGQSDYCKTLVFTSGSAVAVSLPPPGTAGGFGIGFWAKPFAEGAGTVTITPTVNAAGTTPTINGSSSLALATTHSATIYVGTDGNYYATYNGG